MNDSNQSINWNAINSLLSGNGGGESPEANSESAVSAAVAQSRRNLEVLQRARAEQIEAEKRNRNSLVGQLGLDTNTGVGATVNAAAAWAAAGSRLAGNVLAAPFSGNAAAQQSATDEEDKAAYSRYKAGTASEADMVRLNTRPDEYSVTAMEGLSRADKGRERAQAIRSFFDLSGAVDDRDAVAMAQQAERLSKDDAAQISKGIQSVKDGEYLDGAGNVISGLAGMASERIGLLADNPAATVNAAGDLAANLALSMVPVVGVPLTAAANADMASSAYEQGLAKWRKENPGQQYPDQETLDRMGLGAAGVFAAEMGSDLLMKGAATAAGKVFAKEAGEEVAQTGVKAALGSGAKGAAKLYGTAEAEGLAEVAATYAEGVANLEGSDSGELFLANTLGFGLGGATPVVVGTGAAAVGAKNVLKEAKAEAAVALEKEKERNAAFKAATEAGTPDAFLDRSSPAYSPDKAMGVLFELSNKEGTTPEQRTEYQSKANDIINSFEAQIVVRKNALAGGNANLQAEIAQLEQELATAAPEDRADTQALLDLMREEAAAGTVQLSDEQKQVAETEVAALEKKLETARQLYDIFSKEAVADTLKDVDLDSTLTAADADVSQADEGTKATASEAVKKVIVLSMASPEALAPERAEALANNTKNALTEGERNYLRSYAAAEKAVQVAKKQKQVANEVINGDAALGQKGLLTYRERFGTAMAAGNRKQARAEMAGLAKFIDSHSFKLGAFEEAAAAFKATGIDQVVTKQADGGYDITPRAEGAKLADIRKANGFVIGKYSDGVMGAVQAELSAMQATQASLQLAFDIPRNAVANPNSVQAPNVQNAAPQSQPESQPGSEQPAVQLDSADPANVNAAAEAPVVETVRAEAGDSAAQRDAGLPGTGGNPQLEGAGVNTEAENTSVSEADTQTDAKAGALTALTSGADNIAARTITQTVGNDAAKSKRPLVAVKDFLSSLLSGQTKIEDFLAEDLDNDSQEAVALRFFARTARRWNQRISTLVAANPNPKYAHQSPVEYLLNMVEGKPDFDENVKTAISMAAMTWAMDTFGKGRFNREEDLRAILGLDDNADIPAGAWELLGTAGVRRNTAANAIGQQVVSALGLKVSADAPKSLLPRIESALGLYALEMLMREGVVEPVEISGARFAEMTGKASTDQSATQIFMRLKRDASGEPVAQVAAIVEALRGSKGVIEKLFSVEPGTKAPTFEPVPFTQKKAKGSRKNVPAWLAKVLDKKNKEQNFVRQDMWNLVSHLDPQLVLQMAGFEEVGAGMHKSRRASVQAKNDGLVRELQNILGFVRDTLEAGPGLEQPLYFQHTAWKQQRVGIVNNLINPQTSKIHRHMLFKPTWETKVNANKPADMENFKLRVLEGMGVKTDKQSNAASLSQWEKKTSNPVIQAAVNALVAREQGQDLSEAQQKAIAAGVKEAGEKFQSLDALLALAQYQNRDAEGNFTVRLMGEVDGVTNGPMLSHILLGAAHNAGALFSFINRGGFFQQGSEHSNYNVWRGSDGKMDLYETTASGVIARIQKLVGTNENLDAKFNAIWTFTGRLEENGKVVKAGRNIVKKPITALMFGSATGKIVDGMAEEFVESIYKTIESLAQNEAGRINVIRQINTLLDGTQELSESMTVAELMETEFNKAQMSAIKETFTDTFGDEVKKAMEESFSAILQRRDQMTKTANFAFGLYDSAYKALREGLIAELAAKGELEVDGAGKPIWDLNVKQEGQLARMMRKMEPVMHTLASLRSGDLNAGLPLAKQSRELSQDAKYSSTVRLNPSASAKGTKSAKVNAQADKFEAPGVAMVPMSTHSLDSAISHEAAALTEALNIHDAHGTGLGTFRETAANLNQATWNALLEYSPAQEMYDSLERTVEGMLALMEDPEFTPAMAAAIKGFLINAQGKAKFKGTLAQFLAKQLTDAKQNALHADETRLATLAQLESLDQYALEGGQYTVTDADRAKAQEKLDALAGEVPAELMAKVQQFDAMLNSVKPRQIEADWMGGATPGVQEVLGMSNAQAQLLMSRLVASESVPASIRPQIEMIAALMNGTGLSLTEAVNQELNNAQAAGLVEFLAAHRDAAKSTPFGVLAAPVIAPEADVVALMEANPDMSGQEALKALHKLMRSRPQTPMNSFYFNLIGMTSRILGKDVRVKYVTALTAPDEVLASPTIASRGWYVADNGTVYVLSPDFATSGLTAELLLHELTHAALSKILDNPSEEQKPVVAELNELLAKAKEYVAANQLSQFGPATSSLHELLSWGLTNEGFQKQVLAKVQIESKTKLAVIRSGMQAFVESMVKLLFPKANFANQTALTNGFSALVYNATAMYAKAAKQQDRQVEQGIERTNQVLSQAWVNPDETITNFTTEQVFEALGQAQTGQVNSSGFQARLESVLSDVVNAFHGPFGAIKASIEAKEGKTALDAWSHLMARGERPFAARALAANLPFTLQESFVTEQVEAVMGEVLSGKSAPNSMIYRELEKLFTQARNQLKGKIDPDLYRFVFMVTPEMGGKSDYMTRFVALTMGHEGFNKAMGFDTQRPELSFAGKPFMERIAVLWRAAVDWLSARMTGTYLGQSANQRAEALVRKLIQIEAKAKEGIKARKSMWDFMEPLEERAANAVAGVKSTVVKATSSNFVRDNTFTVVRASGTVARIVAGDRVEAVVEGITKMRNDMMKGRPGTSMELLNYIKGPGEWMQRMVQVAKGVEKTRQEIINKTARSVLAAFKDGGEYLTSDQKTAVSAVLLRTGAHKLLDQYKVTGIKEMLENRRLLDKAIQKEVGLLSALPEVHYYVKQAKGLANLRVTGWTGVENQNLNASNIAKLFGTERDIPADYEGSVEVIERLVALYALKYSDKQDGKKTKDLLEVFRTESNREGDNGIEMVLKMHKHLEEDAKGRLFKGNEALMMHGYLPEVHNPKTTFQVAREDAEAEELEKQGFTLYAPVELDKSDPDQRPARLYVLRGGGLVRRQTGAVSYTGSKAKGKSKHGNYYNPFDQSGVQNMQDMNQIAADKAAAVADQFNPDPYFEPGAYEDNKLVPLFNAAGQVVDYRYMMKEDTRDNLLDRDNRFEHLLGVMAGTTFDKEKSREQNAEVIAGLREHFEKEFPKDNNAFILVGEASTDPEMREIWDLLPENTKRDVQKSWKGQKGMWVPKNLVTPLFGFKKATLSSVFDKEKRNFAEQALVDLVNGMVDINGRYILRKQGKDLERYQKQGAVMLRRAEEGWQEVVQEMKDFIVVKTGTVLLGNITSNFTLLAMHGVPLKDMVVLQKEALNAVMDYQRDNDALFQLQSIKATGYSGKDMAEVDSEIALLENRIARNPAKELIDAGLLPTIVEDLTMEDNPYSYKSQLSQWVDGKVSGVNEQVVNVAKLGYMTHDTTLYQVLSKSTQYSDFVARYALYKHLTEKAKEPMSKEDALFQATESFINYDLPLPKWIQYADDMGFMMFTKYFLSVQRVLARLMRDNPLQVLNTVALNNLFLDMPIVTDSAAVFRIGNNPLDIGALGLPGTIPEALTIQSGLDLVK